jgi:hypothetical protein
VLKPSSLKAFRFELLIWRDFCSSNKHSVRKMYPTGSSSSVRWRPCVLHVIHPIPYNLGFPTAALFFLMILRFRVTTRQCSAMKRRAAGDQIGSTVPARLKIQPQRSDAIVFQTFGSVVSRTDPTFRFSLINGCRGGAAEVDACHS